MNRREITLLIFFTLLPFLVGLSLRAYDNHRHTLSEQIKTPLPGWSIRNHQELMPPTLVHCPNDSTLLQNIQNSN